MIATAYSGHATEKHDTTTCLQQNLQFRFRNLPNTASNRSTSGTGCFHHLKIYRRVDLSRSPHRGRPFDILNHCLSKAWAALRFTVMATSKVTANLKCGKMTPIATSRSYILH